MHFRVFAFLWLCSAYSFFCCAQEASALSDNNAPNSETEQTFVSIPDNYRGIALGTAIDTVKEMLQKDGEFGFRGDRDVSLLPFENRSLIETSGGYFIKRAWFQFHNDSLYIISVALNTEKNDYYSLYTALSQKYGEPLTLNQRTAVWEDESVRMILERPLTVRYISVPVFTELQNKKHMGTDYQKQLKEDFIEQF